MSDDLHGWGPALEEIERRKSEALSMGGEARLIRQKERGRLNAVSGSSLFSTRARSPRSASW